MRLAIFHARGLQRVINDRLRYGLQHMQLVIVEHVSVKQYICITRYSNIPIVFIHIIRNTISVLRTISFNAKPTPSVLDPSFICMRAEHAGECSQPRQCDAGSGKKAHRPCTKRITACLHSVHCLFREAFHEMGPMKDAAKPHPGE